MAGILTVRLDDDLADALDRVCTRTGRSRDDVVRDALRRHLRRTEFELIREQLVPYAEAAGWFTDEDVFRDVS